MIVPVSAQLKGDDKPKPHLALIFSDVMNPLDFITYRNALLRCMGAVVSIEDGIYNEELYWLTRLIEHIDKALDVELSKKRNNQ